MKVTKVYEIPDQGGIRGGDLYDVHDNLDFFADTSALVEKSSTAVDKSVTVKASTAQRWLRDSAPYSRQSFTYERSYGGGRNKGALPGYTITLVSDAGLPGEERRQFQYTGTLSAFVAWLKTTAKMLIDVYGPSGSLNASIPGTSP